MIYKENTLLFSAIPKTGTTAISSHINEFFKYKTKTFIEIDNKKDFHPSIWDMNTWIDLNNLDLSNLFYCAITRNPYDRFVSHYFYSVYVKDCYEKYKCTPFGFKLLKKHETIEIVNEKLNSEIICDGEYNSIINNAFLTKPTEEYLQVKKILENINSFDDFVYSCCEKKEDNGFPPQIIFTHHVKDYSGRKLDYIGKYEELQNSFDYICNKINIPSVKLEKTNKSEHKHFTEYYNKDLQQKIYNLYNIDFKYFNYDKNFN